MSENPISVQRVDHVAIDVSDVERAKAFYGGVVGLREVDRPPSFDFGGAWYRIGPVDLHLVNRQTPATSGGRHFCLWVDNVRAAAQRVEAAGYAVTWDTKYKIRGVDRFFIHDPDGNRVEFQGSDGTGADRFGAGT
jgi:catechol 2,3-dioxygenase-like lactoylglutathione lyase family enzyme